LTALDEAWTLASPKSHLQALFDPKISGHSVWNRQGDGRCLRQKYAIATASRRQPLGVLAKMG
jgi:hypothetical protein